ncbi:hypothetical protein GQ600_27177 [Phytophthora cactorum]|nr:hypothetical protein GQ600_27177 [Phytophthora cactorum]
MEVMSCIVLDHATTSKLRNEAKAKRPRSAESIEDGSELHVLTPIAVKIELSSCLRSIQSKSRYGCAKCLRGYHVACFNVVHYPSAFHASTPSVTRALGAIRSAANGEAPAKTRRRLKLEDLEVAQ